MTAVEFLKQNLPSLFQDDSGHYETLFEQAKEMEKQQIIDAFYQCGRDNFEHIKVINRSATEYYDDTYGSKGSDTPQDAPQVSPQVSPQVTSSQIEISDEEIEKAANDADNDGYSFREGAKWYREQLKQRQ